MEHQKIYRVSLLTIGAFMLSGLLFFAILVMALREAPKDSLTEVLVLSLVMGLLSASLIGYSMYFWRKRKAGKGFYCDDEGIIIDLKGNKVRWDEIERIQYSENHTVPLSKSTVVYPHYTHHEKIRIRLKKWMPTTAHSIDWFMIEKPREYHEHVMKVWKEKDKLIG